MSLYDYRWQQSRLVFLERNPLCVFCQQQGRVTAASIVDHIKPHRGDEGLFWDTNNWQSLCAVCHSSIKQAIENGSKRPPIGLDGWPMGGGDV